jgi:putative SOS response-associated peptidase YedK
VGADSKLGQGHEEITIDVQCTCRIAGNQAHVQTCLQKATLPDSKSKQPFYFCAKDGPLSFAGLWETATVDEVTIDSCTIITTASNDLMRLIHNRMPVILPPEVWDAWLTPTQQPDDTLLSLLQLSAEPMQLWPVSPAVGRTSNQGEQLIEPVNE